MSRYVAKEGGQRGFNFDQRYAVVGMEGKIEMDFADQLGVTMLLDFTLAGELFARYLEHEGKIPKRESRAKRRVMVAVGGSFLAGSSGRQVIERYSLSRHDVLAPDRIIRLADENRDPIVQADLAKPRRLSTVLKHGASRKDLSGADPWQEPEAAVAGLGEIVAGLLGEGFLAPEDIEQVGADDERLLELLAAANLGEGEIGRLLRLPAHRLEVLAQAGGWQDGNPLSAEYQRAAELARLLSTPGINLRETDGLEEER